MESVNNNQLLKEYTSLLEKIGLLIPQEQDIDDLGIKIMLDDSIPHQEKELHLTFLTHLSKINEEIQIHYWMTEHLKVLHEFGNILSSTLSKEDIYKKAYELVSRVMDADAFFIAIFNEESRKVHFPFLVENSVRFDPFTINYGEGVVSKVIAKREVLHVKTSMESESLGALSMGDEKIHINSCLYIPLLIGDQIKGVISAQSIHKFTYKKEHVELLKIIGSQVVNAVENTSHYEVMYERSIRDELTNLKNRRAFNKEIEEYLSKASDYQNSLVLIMLDSDNLKKVNDLYGHHIGDIYIKQIAKALLTHCNDGETAYRYAGDEFMLISPNISLDDALKKVNAIQTYLHEHPLEIIGNSLPITVSVGIASYPEHAKNADELKRFADEALYYAKSGGKNEVNIYNNECY